MLNKLIIASLFAYGVLSKSSFIGNTDRAELFELTDNEVAVFRITLPDEEFLQLKEEGGAGLPDLPPIIEGELTLPFDEETFKTKNATMIVELNNKEKSFNKVTFALGGSSSRAYGKQGYNLKIRDKDDDLYGRVHLKLRPDAREPTFLRTKLLSDMHKRLGLHSVSANYATLYINDEYMGFYVLLDNMKLSWIEYEYGEKNSTSLYQCKNPGNYLTLETSNGCTNENDEVTDNSEWIELLTRFDNAQSAEDIEDIFDIDQFLTEIAFEYLSGSWDHFLNFGHNYYLYKPKDDKWKFFLYDFDGELGQETNMANGGPPGLFEKLKTNKTDFTTFTFEEWTKSRHLVDILILKDSTRFDNILRNIVKKAFNPTVLFPHIDELKKFIRPYVELDKIPNENGKYPGRLNEKSDDFSLAQWDANCEFTRVVGPQKGQSYGLKYWILAKYRYVCKAYNMNDCDPVYLDENYEIPIDKNVAAPGEMPTMPPPPPWEVDNSSDIPPIEPPVATTGAELEATTTFVVEQQPEATTAAEPKTTTTFVVEQQPEATTAAEPKTTTTFVVEQQPEATTAAEPEATSTKKSSTSTKRRCIVKKSKTTTKKLKSIKKSKTNSKKFKDPKKNKHHFNKHHNHHF